MIQCPKCGQRYSAKGRACSACGFEVQRIDGFVAWAPEQAHAGQGFKAEYFKPLSEQEAGNYWFCARNALIQWALKKYFPQMTSFLEVGVGTGFVLTGIAQTFSKVRLVGAELFAAGLAFAAQRLPQAEMVQMDARAIPYVEEFDAAGAFDVLEHIEEDQQVLKGLFRAIRPGGGLLLTVPQHPWLWSPIDDYSFHQRRYRSRALHTLVRAAGFQILRSTSFVSLLLPALLLSRMRARPGQEVDPFAEVRVPLSLNRALEQVLGWERTLIQWGIDLPLGGSRLVVARRPI